MSTSDDDRSEAPGPDGSPPVWGDVTDRQPERDVPEPAADAYAVPPRDPNAPPPPPPTEEQLRAGQPEGFADPAGQPGAPSGAPVFVNPDHLTVGAPQAAPTFVRPGGQPIAPARSVQPHAGGPVFVAPGQPGGAGGPVFVKSGVPMPASGPVPVAQPVAGGPVFMAPNPTERPVDDEHPWAWWVGPLGFVIAFLAVIALGVVLLAIGGLTDGGAQAFLDDNTQWAGLLQDVVWVGVVLLVPFLIAGHLRPAQLGLRRAPFGLSAGILVVAFFGFAFVSWLYALAFSLDESSNKALQDTGFGSTVGSDILYALLFTVAAPVAEELLFRGLLFRTLRDGLTRAWGPKGGLAGGALLSGIIFGGVHLGGGQDKFLPVLMMFGVVLALAYHWSGSLYVPIVLHSINNAIATGSNSDPAADWIYGLIAAGPVIAVLTAVLIAAFVRKVFRPEPKYPAPPHAGEPATL